MRCICIPKLKHKHNNKIMTDNWHTYISGIGLYTIFNVLIEWQMIHLIILVGTWRFGRQTSHQPRHEAGEALYHWLHSGSLLQNQSNLTLSVDETFGLTDDFTYHHERSSHYEITEYIWYQYIWPYTWTILLSWSTVGLTEYMVYCLGKSRILVQCITILGLD
jgi:hypothetical protein